MQAQYERKESTIDTPMHELNKRKSISAADITPTALASLSASVAHEDNVASSRDSDARDELETSDCVICLNTCEDRTVLDTCHHEFCFHCILQWSMVSHSCPLCIRIFKTCIHNIIDGQDSTVFRFEPLPSSTRGSYRHSSSASSVSETYRRPQPMAVPYGIIRQLYGPPQNRRRFRNDRTPVVNESVDERSVAEQQQDALEKRRHVYRHRLFAKHVGANKISGFQQITPETFKVFPHKLERLVPWIRRELSAILSLTSTSYPSTTTTCPSFSSSSSSSISSRHVEDNRYQEIDTGLELIREYIIAVLKRYDLQTDQAQDLLRDFLHEQTEQFVHELMAFARSPYSIEAYDRSTQYDEAPASSQLVYDRRGGHGVINGPKELECDRREIRREGARSQDLEDRRGRQSTRSESRQGDSDVRYTRSRIRSRESPNRDIKRRRSNRTSSPRKDGFSSTVGRNTRRARLEHQSGSGSTSRSRSRNRSRSRGRSIKDPLRTKSCRESIATDSSLEAPRSSSASVSVMSEAKAQTGKQDLGGSSGPASLPRSSNRSALIAVLQAKLERERELYDAKKQEHGLE